MAGFYLRLVDSCEEPAGGEANWQADFLPFKTQLKKTFLALLPVLGWQPLTLMHICIGEPTAYCSIGSVRAGPQFVY
jgi:hypothetical protein